MRDGAAILQPERILPVLPARTLVMDACPLTGVALCELAAGVIPDTQGRFFTTLSGLADAVAQSPRYRTLVVTELFSATEGISAGLALLAALVTGRAAGLRVVVCTAVTDPLLLRLVLDLQPSALVLRREPLAVLAAAMSGNAPPPRTRLSPGVSTLLARSREAYLTPRESEWLLTQADGLGLQGSADRLQVTYKTAAALRYRVIHRLGDNATTFAQRMAALRTRTGFSPAT